MRLFLDRYAAYWRAPGAPRFIVLSLFTRLPLGTVGLATLLHVRDLTGSIAFAGSLVGVQLVASAVASPLLGRWIDRRGPRAALATTGVVTPLAMLLVLFAGPLGLSRPALLAAAALIGTFMPPITVLTRALLRHRFADEAQRRIAFAADSVLLELAYTIGPALIAITIAVATPRAAFAVALAWTAAAVPLLFASGGLRWWRREPPGDRHFLGPLTEPRLLALYAATFALTMSFGAVEVGYPGFAGAIGSAPWGPALVAINSVGSALGGLLYGGSQFRMPLERQLPRIAALLALPVALHALVGAPWPLVPLAFAAGFLIAPAMTVVTLLVARIAPPRYATEAFTWSATAIVTGVGAGMAASGALIEQVGSPAAFLFAAASALVAAALALRLSSLAGR
jgi:predicted MFS family arabinose efflux permease